MRVLVVDDHPHVRDLVRRTLERDGYVVATAKDATSARRWLDDNEADVLILDLGLPDGDGIELCRSLRREGLSIGVLMLTALSAVATRVAGLDAGADDFLPKPFAIAELRARVRAISRRATLPRQPLLFERGDVSVDFAARHAFKAKHEIALTGREWAILEVLRQGAGRVVHRDELLETVWGKATDGAEKSLEVLIGRIRRKLGEPIVRTIRGEGYALSD